ncbi:hypothetical protein D7X55_42780, partial [Corallococcus sp. AB049A]
SAGSLKKRGPPAKVPDASARRVAELEKQLAQTQVRLKRAEALSRTGGMDRVRVGQADRPGEFVREPVLEFAALTRLGSAKRIA